MTVPGPSTGAGKVSATEALLSQTAAVTPAEVHAARLALIATGAGASRPLDRSGVRPVVGDGGAGTVLLGSRNLGGWLVGPGPSCAARSSALLVRDAPRAHGYRHRSDADGCGYDVAGVPCARPFSDDLHVSHSTVPRGHRSLWNAVDG